MKNNIKNYLNNKRLEQIFKDVNLSENNQVYIFDMDGTLYRLDGIDNGYCGSTLEKTINTNAALLALKQESCDINIAKKLVEQAIKDKVGISRFFAKRYDLTRNEIFEIVWDISPELIIKTDEVVKKVVSTLKAKNIFLVLLTAAPKIWQRKVFSYLGFEDIFQAVITADDFGSKKEVFQFFFQKFPSIQFTSVGDQLHSDILPAQSLGFKTLLVTKPTDLLTLINQ